MTNHRQVGVLFLAAWLTGATAQPPVTIEDLQPFRKTATAANATLVNLNPAINAWYLLKTAGKVYHLENPASAASTLVPDETGRNGLVAVVEGSKRHPCEGLDFKALEQARASPLLYVPLCGGRIYLRNFATGQRTTLEATTQFLRERIWGGEKIIALGHILMGDAHRETGKMQAAGATTAAKEGPEYPRPALIDPQYSDRLLGSANLGIEVADGAMVPGSWHAASENPGVYVSLLQPNLIAPAILQSHKSLVHPLDSVEAQSLAYLLAFDLDRFELGYARGTEHPGVGWSRQMLDQMRNPQTPGPDGIGNISPLISTGLIRPDEAGRTAATFTAGFKRAHGAFHYGPLALRNGGSHYGFIEQGAVFSRLQPGLATIVVRSDGLVEMKTWEAADDKLLNGGIRHARQNGVPLVEGGIPGQLVVNWGQGNWSGSENGRLRTMRSGAAIQRNNGRRFLFYAVFSDATPSAMARVFQAYGCDYAMLLDMNALEHTYAAVYRRPGGGSQLFVDHLLKGMNVLEKSTASGGIAPRFLGYADNRDFFYLMRRPRPGGKEVAR